MQRGKLPAGVRGGMLEFVFRVVKCKGVLQSRIQLPKLCLGEVADEVGQHRLGQTDEFIAVNAAVVLEAMVNANGHLCGEAVVGRVNRGADDR